MLIADVLGAVLPLQIEDDGAVTVRHDGTVASLRTLEIAEGLEMVSLTQALAWDLPCTDELRSRVAVQASRTMLGTVTIAEQSGGSADVMLRYNFPVGGLDEGTLQTLVLMVLAGGAQVRRNLT